VFCNAIKDWFSFSAWALAILAKLSLSLRAAFNSICCLINSAVNFSLSAIAVFLACKRKIKSTIGS
jgi:hypothetical protein